MRKSATFGVAATIMGLATIFWIRSSVVATSADVRPRAEMLSFCRPVQLESAGPEHRTRFLNCGVPTLLAGVVPMLEVRQASVVLLVRTPETIRPSQPCCPYSALPQYVSKAACACR